MTITPLEARAPQMEAAAASFKIEIVSTSFGLIEENPVEIGKPSTTINGSLSDFDTFISKMGVDYSFSNNPVVAKEYGNVNFIFADSNLSRDYKSSCEINLEEICLKVIKDKQNILFAIML